MTQVRINGRSYEVVVLGDPTTGAPASSSSSSNAVPDGSDVTQGTTTDTPLAWYNVPGSIVAKIGLALAYLADAGSHVITLDGSGRVISDAWTLFGTTRTKTYTYSATQITESDWA